VTPRTASPICTARCERSWCVFDLANKVNEIAQIEAESYAPDFYSDRQHAQRQMQRLGALRDEQTTWGGLDEQLTSLGEIQELLDADADPEMAAEVTASLDAIDAQLAKLRLALLLQGKHDASDAILTLHVGNGGVDAQDYVDMLLRMYLRWAQDHNYKTEILDQSPGEEAGTKNVSVAVTGRYAYGYLFGEGGVHRLIRLSPFDAAHRRQTSFVKVEVMPDIQEDIEITIRPEDIETDTFRATGAGGQHINKTDSAVRIRHLPTGIVVTCQNERSQIQNREVAMRLLRAKLYEREVLLREAEQAKLRGEHIEAAFGSQIRTVTLNPYTLVKDHRTGAETGDTVGYLNGDVDRFIAAYLQSKVGA
jgi:peptide chain release factor 2